MRKTMVVFASVALLATAAAASAAQVTVDVDVLRKLIQEEIGKAMTAERVVAVPVSVDQQVVAVAAPAQTEANNPLTGPAPVIYEESGTGAYVSVAPSTQSLAADAAVFKTVGDTVHVSEPSRGLTVSEKELQAKFFTRLAETKDGRVVEEKIPLMTPGTRYQFNWKIRSAHDLFALARISGLKLVAFGINNIEEAVTGKPQDGPVKTTKVFMVSGVNEKYDLSGTEMLINTAKREVVSSREHRDFDGSFYWVQMIAPVDVVVGSLYPIHHKSAQLRKNGYVVPAGELFTMFVGGKESVLGRDNGRESCKPIHPARVLRK